MRTDCHTPSQIIPSDYEYVAIWTMNIQGFGDAVFMKREREFVRQHMDRTGGTYAHVDTTGSCQVCGNVLAIYLALFWHKPSNTYIRVGFDCTQKLEMSGDFRKFNLFRKNLQNARENHAGKLKAIALLGDAGLSEAWDIYLTNAPQHDSKCELMFSGPRCNCEAKDAQFAFDQFPERTIRDIVGKLVRYGSVSEKQTEFVRNLLNQIAQRPIVEAQRQAEKDAAGPVPTGRVKMSGEVVSVKIVDVEPRYYGDPGRQTKLLIKLDNGSKVYGNQFDSLKKGDRVEFTASVTASDKDPKFGFFKRAKIKGYEMSKDEKKAVAKLNRIIKSLSDGGYDGHAKSSLYTLVNKFYAGEFALDTQS